MYSSLLLILFLIYWTSIDAYIGTGLSWCPKCRMIKAGGDSGRYNNKFSSLLISTTSTTSLSATSSAVKPNELKLTARKSKNWMEVYQAMEVYRMKYNNLYVGRDFVVPNDDDKWPTDTHGLKLGEEVFLIRNTLKYVKGNYQRIMQLRKLGFDFKKDTTTSLSFKEKLEFFESTLKTYQELYDDLELDENFVIPSQLPWEEKYWGMRLGLIVKETLASPETFSPERMLFKKLGLQMDNFQFDTKEKEPILGTERGFDPTMMVSKPSYSEITARSYRKVLHNLDLSPSASVRAYSHFLGAHSPRELNDIIAQHYLFGKYQSRIEQLRYRVFEFDKYFWEDFFECLVIYKNLFGNLDVPLNFVVKDIYGFPEKYMGMQLGRYVHEVRIGDYDAFYDDERKALLDSIGFKWGDPSKYLHFRFFPFCLALRVYAYLFERIYPVEDLVIPDEPQWPTWMVGMPFGEWTRIVRLQKETLEKHYPDRKMWLDTLGFKWWVPVMNVPQVLDSESISETPGSIDKS